MIQGLSKSPEFDILVAMATDFSNVRKVVFRKESHNLQRMFCQIILILKSINEPETKT